MPGFDKTISTAGRQAPAGGSTYCEKSVPSNGSEIRRPLPSAGSCGSVPRLRRYYGALRDPDARPAALRLLRLAVPLLRPFFAPTDTGRCGRGPGVVHRVLLTVLESGSAWASQVPEEPPVSMPSSSTPVGPPRQAIAASWYCLPHLRKRRLPRLQLSRLNHTACALAAYASSPGSPLDDARLASGCRPALPGGGGYPPGSNTRFQALLLSSSPRLILAHRKSRPDSPQNRTRGHPELAFVTQSY